MFNQFNPYNQPYNPQYINDLQTRLNNQVQNQQSQNQTPITQNFQLAPNQPNLMKYMETDEDVAKELVFNDSLFINKDKTILWHKLATGETKKYELKEIVELDEKDKEIAELKAIIEEMKNREYDVSNVDESASIKKSTNVSNDKSSKK